MKSHRLIAGCIATATATVSLPVNAELIKASGVVSQSAKTAYIDAAIFEATLAPTKGPRLFETGDEAVGIERFGGTAGADMDTVGVMYFVTDGVPKNALLDSVIATSEVTTPAKAEAERLRGQGIWRKGFYSSQTGQYVVQRFVSTDDGGLFSFGMSGSQCSAIFGPGVAPEDMPYLGTSCDDNTLNGPSSIAITSDRNQNLEFEFTWPNGRSSDTELEKAVALPIQSNLPDGFEFDTVGITLSGKWDTMQTQITERLNSRGVTVNWQSDVIRDDYLGREIVRHAAGLPEGRLIDHVGEVFYAYTIGNGPDATPFGLVRRTLPMRGEGPLPTSLNNALREKYGNETGLLTVRSGVTQYPYGIFWQFDTQTGTRLDQACTRPRMFSDKLPNLPDRRQSANSLLAIEHRTAAGWGCGKKVEVNHSVPVPGSPLRAIEFTLMDSTPLELLAWEYHTFDMAGQIRTVQAKIDARKAEAEKRESVKPEL